MKISVITPTYNWHENIRFLYEVFKNQTYPDKELLIYDDTPRPSEFLAELNDPEVKYIHSGVRRSIGFKRNFLADMAQGDLVAHFDHDDYYAPEYLERMISAIGSADLLTFDGWFSYHVNSRTLFYWKSSQILPVHYSVGGSSDIKAITLSKLPDPQEWTRRNLYGYGFSYVYRKALLETARFPDTQRHDEDYTFIRALYNQKRQIKTIDDIEGLLLHVVHNSAMSTVLPNYILPDFLLNTLFGEAPATYLSEAFQIGITDISNPQE